MKKLLLRRLSILVVFLFSSTDVALSDSNFNCERDAKSTFGLIHNDSSNQSEYFLSNNIYFIYEEPLIQPIRVQDLGHFVLFELSNNFKVNLRFFDDTKEIITDFYGHGSMTLFSKKTHMDFYIKKLSEHDEAITLDSLFQSEYCEIVLITLPDRIGRSLIGWIDVSDMENTALPNKCYWNALFYTTGAENSFISDFEVVDVGDRYFSEEFGKVMIYIWQFQQLVEGKSPVVLHKDEIYRRLHEICAVQIPKPGYE